MNPIFQVVICRVNMTDLSGGNKNQYIWAAPPPALSRVFQVFLYLSVRLVFESFFYPSYTRTSLYLWRKRSRANCCLGFRQPSITYYPYLTIPEKRKEVPGVFVFVLLSSFFKQLCLSSTKRIKWFILHRECTRYYILPQTIQTTNKTTQTKFSPRLRNCSFLDILRRF